ncbi:ComEA family DNA-binding protein [Candidatus Blastococcus massiliensis]|uniref:ComEA family DNA-binding protein n=1 Tax=Candidatus Blastococcus massiliensis TaxID=1470358 RepID=UPI0004B864D3|nr:ComEA family DNA-binding protein [Candidatus Blastococcus massiliensis]
MRHISRRSDDADVIRARLRALLDDGRRGGWVPEEPEDREEREEREEPEEPDDEPASRAPETPRRGHAADPDVARPVGVGRHRRPGRTVRWDPGDQGVRSLWIAGSVAALVVVAWTWLDRPTVEPAPLPSQTAEVSAGPVEPLMGEAAETSGPVVVAVVGLVARPGLVTVPPGSRVADAVEAAGGFLPGTDPATVNLAAVVTDGQQIAVGVPGSGAAPGAEGPVPGGGAAAGSPVNLNTATAADLDGLPGIGPVLAQRIVDHRRGQGPFRSVDQLEDVPGIGPTIAAELAGLVTV